MKSFEKLGLNYKGQFFCLGPSFRENSFLDARYRLLVLFELVDTFQVAPNGESIAIVRRIDYNEKKLKEYTHALERYILEVCNRHICKENVAWVQKQLLEKLIKGWGYDSCYLLLTIPEIKKCLQNTIIKEKSL